MINRLPVPFAGSRTPSARAANFFAAMGIFLSGTYIFLPNRAICQTIERIPFEMAADSTDHYLAIQPQSHQIKGVLVLLTSFLPPEKLLPETKLHNTAYANDLLTVVVGMKQKIYADSSSVRRIDDLFRDLVTRYAADTAKFVLAGYDEAGTIALRYTELSIADPSQFAVRPKAVFGINTPVDLFGLWHWSERQIRKNFWAGAVGDAKFYLERMTGDHGTIYANPEPYRRLSPFVKDDTTAGNEQFLRNVAVRLYYDTDINWQLSNRRNSFYDTNLPDGSELIDRLLLMGNNKAEFVAAKLPGMQSNGMRHPNSMSIVDEVECIQWIKKSLDIYDPVTYSPAYHLAFPTGWGVERFLLPPDFAPQIRYTGIEDVRFAPGWGDPKSEEYWSYCILWWIEGKTGVSPAGAGTADPVAGGPVIDANFLQAYLKNYYDGLIRRNIVPRNIPADKLFPTVAAVKKTGTMAGDGATYNGTVHMLDYMTRRPMVMNALIHVRSCGPPDHTALFFEISPQPVTFPVWRKMDQEWAGFDCRN